jgi:hypothetical protein
MDIKNIFNEIRSFKFCYYGMGALDQPILIWSHCLLKLQVYLTWVGIAQIDLLEE